MTDVLVFSSHISICFRTTDTATWVSESLSSRFPRGLFLRGARRGPGSALSGSEGGAQGDSSGSHCCARMQFGQSRNRNSDLDHYHSHSTHLGSWPLSTPAYSYPTRHPHSWSRHCRRQRFSHTRKNRVKKLRESTVC